MDDESKVPLLTPDEDIVEFATKRSRRRSVKKRHLLGLLSFVLAFLCVLLYAIYVDDSFLPKRITYDQFALWFKPWRKWPLEEGLYQGTNGLRSETSNISVDSTAEEAVLSALAFDAGHASAVSCETIDGASYPVFALNAGFENKDFPAPSFGLAELSGDRANVCLDRATRLSPYGRVDGESNHALEMMSPWGTTRLGKVQESCIERNGHRLSNSSDLSSQESSAASGKAPRTAVLLRAYDAFNWRPDDIVNTRAMLTELSLWSSGEYQVFILLHVKNTTEARLTPDEELKKRYIPDEFIDMTEVWSYDDPKRVYPAVGEYEVFFHTWMPVQIFANEHPEFQYIWNWEMDIRSTGHYGQMFKRMTEWAAAQKKDNIEERNARFYIPSHHGSYDAFAESLEPKPKSLAPVRQSTEDEVVGDADLITLFPIFDPAKTKWQWRDYIVHYLGRAKTAPRVTTIGTNHRLSRRLLMAMNRENKAGRAMMSEMWPTAVAQQDNLNAVFVPHPVWIDRKWPAEELQTVFNSRGGPGLHVGGSRSRKFEGTSWFFNSKMPLELYSRWTGRATTGPGSKEWETANGQMCLPGMLLHPVKSSRLPEGVE